MACTHSLYRTQTLIMYCGETVCMGAFLYTFFMSRRQTPRLDEEEEREISQTEALLMKVITLLFDCADTLLA